MRHYPFLVVGRYDCERNSWIPGGDIRHVVSRHCSNSAAWQAVPRAHQALGGCDGSDLLCTVVERAPEGYEPEEFEDTYEDDGVLYSTQSYWDHHEFVFSGGAIVAIPK